MAKFLDLTGLTQFKNKLQEWAIARFVPATRRVNGKALSADVTLTATDVQAIPASQKGAASGVASLDESGKVPSTQLPSYVDDVIEGYLHEGKFYEEEGHSTEITGESGKIYMDLTSENTYRWSGSTFVEISKSLALGETSSTAFAGDKGKVAYDHANLTSGNPHNVTKAEVGLGNVDNVKQLAGLASGTTEDHVVTFGANGYEVKDSGFTIAANVPADAKFTDTVYTHPAYTAQKEGLYKVTVDATGHVSAVKAVVKDDITALGIPGSVPTKVSDLTNDAGYQTADDVTGILTDGGYLTEIPDEYVTETELTAKGYQTATQVSTAITEATADFITAADLPTAITEEEIDGLFA